MESMRINKQDRAENLIKLTPENLEDLWHIERILAPGDEVEGVSWRTFKASETANAEKKKINVRLRAEKIEFARHANRLRVSGKILSGTPEEFVQVGSYHTLDVEPNFAISIYKEWKMHHLSRIKQAMAETKRPRLYMLVMDEKEAAFATMRGFGASYEWELEYKGSKRDEAKKQAEEGKQFFGELLSRLERLEDVHRIVIAGPGFAASNFMNWAKEKNPKLAARFVLEHCTYADRTGVNELLKKGVVKRVASEERVALELQVMEEFKSAIAKNSERVCYGLANVRAGVESRAALKVLVLDELLRQKKNVEEIVELAQTNGVEVMIFSHESDGGRELAGLGGLAAFLRFALPPT